MPKSEFGLVIPPHITRDPQDVIRFAQEAERLNYQFLSPYSHSGMGEQKEGDPYKRGIPFPEVHLLLMAIAGKTDNIKLFPTVLVWPQMQTVDAAQKAATLDSLTQGRVELAVAVGWNPSEFAALGIDFHRRGQRFPVS